MSFETIEESRDLGAPIALYLFRYGENAADVYGYTDAETELVVDGVLYAPVPIDRGAISASGTTDKATLEVRAANTLPIADLFRFSPPSQIVTLVVRDGHAGSDDFRAVWSGRVLGCAWRDNEIVFTCEPISTALRRAGLRRHYQYGCQHVLYGPLCRANKAAATVNTSVSAVNGPVVTLSPGWPGAGESSRFVQGMIEWVRTDGRKEVRTIQRVQDGNILTLVGATPGLTPGAVVSVIKGCTRDLEGCEQHDNLPNYGGQPWIPTKNPIGIRNSFY